MKQAAPSGRAIANRIAAGLVGGYALAAAAAFGLAAILPGPRIEAVTWAQLAALLLFVLAALWSFVPRRGTVVWGVLLIATAAFLLAGLLGGRA